MTSIMMMNSCWIRPAGAAGLQIDQIESAFTEERRIVHNSLNPDATYSKEVVDHPFYLLYHISKPT